MGVCQVSVQKVPSVESFSPLKTKQFQSDSECLVQMAAGHTTVRSTPSVIVASTPQSNDSDLVSQDPARIPFGLIGPQNHWPSPRCNSTYPEGGLPKCVIRVQKRIGTRHHSARARLTSREMSVVLPSTARGNRIDMSRKAHEMRLPRPFAHRPDETSIQTDTEERWFL